MNASREKTEGGTVEKFRWALSELATRQKTAKGVSLYSLYVNRPVGRVLASAAHCGGLTPNQVTLASAVSSAFAIALLVSFEPSIPLGLLVTSFLVLGFALDSADGQLARLTGTGSPAGEWLDHVVDAGKMVALHSAVLISFYRFSGEEPWTLLIPLIFQLSEVVMFVAGTLVSLLSRVKVTPYVLAPSRVRAIALLAADYGVLCLAFLLYGAQPAFLVAYGILAMLRVVFMVLFLMKWYRELQTTHAPL